MMEPDPLLRPSIDEVLLHPCLQNYMVDSPIIKAAKGGVITIETPFAQRKNGGFSPTQANPCSNENANPNHLPVATTRATIIISPSMVAKEQKQRMEKMK